MGSIPKRVQNRIASNLKNYQKVIRDAVDRDINEADTGTIVTDMFADLFGFDKYSEVTSEHSIRGTFCDLALKTEEKLRILVEIKAVGVTLKETHIKQAVDYGVRDGVEWILLTNGTLWKVFRVIFSKPIDTELICEWNFLELNSRDVNDLQKLFLLTREGIQKAALKDFYSHKQATDRYAVGALLLYDNDILKALRRELRRIYPNVSVDIEEIQKVLTEDVIKREIVTSDQFKEAQKIVRKAQKKQERKSKPKMKLETKPDLEPKNALI